MKRLTLAAIMALVCVAQGAIAAEAPNPVGTWRVKFSFRGGTRISMLQIEAVDGKLSGKMFRRPGDGNDVDKVRFVEDTLTFETSRTRNRQTFTTRYKGKIDQDSITGTAEFQRSGRTSSWSWVAERSDPSALDVADEKAPVEADIDLNADNYDVWREHILPELEEMAWSEIPWLSTFKDGILAADAANKPLLFWTMNGHPLGCT